MTDQDLQQIKEYVEKKIKLIIPTEHWAEMVKRNLEHSYVVEVLTTKYNFGEVGANKIADDIAAMLKAVQSSSPPVNTGAQTTQVQTTKSKISGVPKWLVGVVLCIVIASMIVMLGILCWQVEDLKDKATASNYKVAQVKSDTEVIRASVTDTDSKGNPVNVMQVARDIRTNMTETMLKKSDLDDLAHKDDVTDMLKKSDLDDLAHKDDVKGLAKKTDLDGLATTEHLKRVEHKLDAHLADLKADLADKSDESLVDPYADDDGTISLKVPKGSTVRSLYSDK